MIQRSSPFTHNETLVQIYIYIILYRKYENVIIQSLSDYDSVVLTIFKGMLVNYVLYSDKFSRSKIFAVFVYFARTAKIIPSKVLHTSLARVKFP